MSPSLKYFINFNPIYHEICSTGFNIDDFIIRLIRNIEPEPPFNEFERSGPTFKTLKAFCELSKATVNNSLRQYYETQLITKNLLTNELFMSHMNSSTTYFQSVTPNRFFDILVLIRETTRINQFIGLLPINYKLHLHNDMNHIKVSFIIIDHFIDINNQSCSSIIDRQCKQQCMIGLRYSYIPQVVPGFYVSFYSVESLLLSELRCLYNTSFMSMLRISDKPDTNNNLSVLSQPSRFSINSTYALLANKLFIESWGPQSNYTAYFEQCRPRLCMHIDIQRPTFVSVISTVISLFGGLSPILRFVIPLVVTFIIARCYRQEQQEGSSENVQERGKNNLKIHYFAQEDTISSAKHSKHI